MIYSKVLRLYLSENFMWKSIFKIFVPIKTDQSEGHKYLQKRSYSFSLIDFKGFQEETTISEDSVNNDGS